MDQIQAEGRAVQRTAGGWNPWTVILIFSFLQILIFALEWYFLGAVYLSQ